MQHPAAELDRIDALTARVVAHRADELARFQGMLDRYGASIYTAEALSRELFGMELAEVLTADPSGLALDWREDAPTRERLAVPA